MLLWLTAKQTHNVIDQSPAALNQPDPDASHLIIDEVNDS